MASEVRVRIVSAILLAFAVLSQLEIGAGPEKGPCLSVFQRQEALSWSAYASGLYSISAERVLSAGEMLIHRAMLLNPSSESLRSRWLQVWGERPDGLTRSCELYREVYEAAPADVDNTLCYVMLLCRNKQKEEALRILKSSLDRLSWHDGVLLCFYLVMDEYKHHEDMPELFLEASKSDDCGNRWALDVCWALYWGDDWVMATRRLNAELKELGWFGKWRLKHRIEHARRKAVEAVARMDISRVRDFMYVSVCAELENMAEWERLAEVLKSASDDFVERQGKWWVQAHLKLYKRLKNPQMVYDGLSRTDIRRVVPVKTVRQVIGVYLSTPELYEEAIKLQFAIVEISNGAVPEVMRLARMLMLGDDAETALEILEPLDVDKLSLEDRLFRDNVLARTGNNQRAYDDYVQIEFASRLKLRYPQLDVQFYYQYAMACIALNKLDRALELAAKGYELAPENPIICNFYGYILADYNRDLALSEELVRKALKADARNIAYLDSLAWVYFRRGRYREALRWMTQVLVEGGGTAEADDEIASHLNQIFLKLGLPGAASLYQAPVADTP